MSSKLDFEEFTTTDAESWLSKIHTDLKGRAFDETLVWQNTDGIKVNATAFARYQEIEDSQPGVFPYFRGNQRSSGSFDLGQTFNAANPQATNKLILESLNCGTNLILLEGTTDIGATLAGVEPSYISLALKNGSTSGAKALLEFIADHKTPVKTFLNLDPLVEADHDLSYLKENVSSEMSLYVLGVNGARIANAGASITSELVYSLLCGHQYLYELMKGGATVDEASASISFTLSCGPLYFLEIAKIRAFRRLWAQVVNTYKPEHGCSTVCWIHSETARWNKVDADIHNNLLRATTEAMSAVIGGADSIEVNWQGLTDKDDAYNQRMARNIAHLIREESYLDAVTDPAGGSYLIEDLTLQLTRRAWSEFKRWENEGGIGGRIDDWRKIVEAEKVQTIQRYESGESTLVGANKFAEEGVEFTASTGLKFQEF